MVKIELGNGKGTQWSAVVEFIASDMFPEPITAKFPAKDEHDAHVTLYKLIRNYVRDVKRQPGNNVYNGFIPKYQVVYFSRLG
jgi:hypothetical protein